MVWMSEKMEDASASSSRARAGASEKKLRVQKGARAMKVSVKWNAWKVKAFGLYLEDLNYRRVAQVVALITPLNKW